MTSVATPFNAADQAAVCSLVAHFGADVLKRSLLVFSHGDVLAADEATLADYLADAPPDLQVRGCRRGIVECAQLTNCCPVLMAHEVGDVRFESSQPQARGVA